MITPSFILLLAQTSASKQETPPFTLGPATPVATPAQIVAESAHVLAFARIATTNRNGGVNLVAFGNGVPLRLPDEDAPRRRGYRVGNLTVWVNVISGLVVGAAGGTDHSTDRPGRQRVDRHGHPGSMMLPRLVTDEEAKDLTLRFLAATGRTYGVKVLDIDEEGAGNGDNLAINFLPTYRDVPFDDRWGGQIQIDRETGQLDSLLLLGEPPAPPDDLTVNTTGDDAHLVALRAAARAGTPVSDFPDPSLYPVIALLDRRPIPSSSYNFTPADHEDAVARRTRLVYDVRLFDPRGPDTIYTVLVDAHDGRLLQVGRETLHWQSAPTMPKPPALSFSPPATLRPWRVSEDDGPWSAPTFTTLIPASAEGFAPGHKVLLTDGKVAFPASVDPATGRIALDGPDGKPQVYQPGPALAELLRRRTKG